MTLIQITTTSDDQNELEKISTHLIANRLAACCQISGPITSHYAWQGKLEKSEEWLCTIKTTQELYEKVETEITKLHHYDEPEIIAVEIIAASSGYKKWIQNSVHP